MTSPLPCGVLFLDLYQLTMAQVYYSFGMADQNAYFEHYFRTYPRYGDHRAGYCVSAGLKSLLDLLPTLRFGETELSALAAMRSGSGAALFGTDFLDWLGEHGDFGRLRIQATADGRVVHPHTPITVVEGPLALGQILETVLLNHRNFATLIATKAARVKQAAQLGTVLEFGMRRAAGKGANLATEAALLGGADFSSNVGASLQVGLPPRGTHAHSLVQAFIALGGDEIEAFRAFARIYPDDCVLLVDTVDTLESGIPNAIEVFEELRRKGHRPVGIRLDSGDPAQLAPAAARMLDDAGFETAVIVVSDRLDELAISRICRELTRQTDDPDRLMRRMVYGVGTRLVSSQESPSLDGVYKLAAVCQNNDWKPAFKLTDDPAKRALPGRKTLWRRYRPDGTAVEDLVTLAGEDPADGGLGHYEKLLEKVWGPNSKPGGDETIETARVRRMEDLAGLAPEYLDLIDPARYPVSSSSSLKALRHSLFEPGGQTKDQCG